LRRLFTFCTVLALIATLAVTASAAAPQPPGSTAATQVIHTAASKTSREIFGYALSGSLSNPDWGYASWNFSLLTTVAYFGIHINASGVMVDDSGWQTWNSSAATGLISTAHANGVKVLMTVVLQDFAPSTPTMCSGLANRDTTVLQTVRAMKARGADGISIDYEGLNGTCPNGQTARAMMTDLVRQFRAALGTGPYLSVATYGSAAMDPIGFFDITGMAPYADSFFVMAYDLEYSNYYRSPLSCSSFCIGPTGPLTTYYWNDTQVLNDYLAIVPASKVILGVPYYGRKACVTSAVPNALATSTVVPDTYLDAMSEATDPSVRAGSYATHRDVHDTAGMERWDTWYNASLGCTRELYFDDAASLAKKYDIVNQDGLRGVGVWTLDYGGGAPELWAAMSAHFSSCTSVTASESAASPQPAGTQVLVTAAAAGCSQPRLEFWLLPPGGTWTLVQAYSTSTAFNWNTTGKAAGTYRFSVWARNSGSASSYDSFAAFDYTITPTCPLTTTTSTPPSTATIGNAVTISASASGCPNPRYEYWLKSPGGGWVLVQGYSTSAAYHWTTTGKAAGTYRFSVWTRDVTSPNTYDGFSAFDYALTLDPCAAIAASPVPASAAPAGSTVTITAAATGCAHPLYEFWVLAPGGVWSLAQGYSSSATLKWSSSGKPAGSYRFSVWARDASSHSAYDAFSAFNYSLTPVCQATNVSTVPSSEATAGNNVTLTGRTSGCPSPLYEFWILPPGGSWTLAQAYSTSATFKWITKGKPIGSYRFSVWAKDAGSPNAYDAFNAFLYTLV
jgi:spore germination protein YaaH